MKIKTACASIFCVCMFLLSNAQSTLPKLQNQIKELVGNVENSKNKYEQSWSVQNNSSNVKLELTTVDVKKANTIREVSTMNLALLDEKTSRVRSTKELFTVEFRSADIKSIEWKEDENETSFVDRFQLFFSDEENAKTCDSLLQLAIVESRVIFDKDNQLPTTYSGLSEYISSKIMSFKTNDLSITNEIKYDHELKDIVSLELKKSENGEGQENKISIFSLADLDPEKVNLQSKGDIFQLNLNTKQKQKFIEISESADSKSYTSSTVALLGSPEHALLLEKAFKAQIPLAKEILAKRMKVYTSMKEAKLDLKTAIEKDNGIEGQTIEYLDDKVLLTSSGISKMVQGFYFEDIDDDLNLNFKKGTISANLMTKDKVKYVYKIKDNEQEDFSNSIDFYIADIESMRSISNAIKYIQENLAANISVKDMAWLSGKLEKESQGVNQALDQQKELKCKYIYTTEDDDKAVAQSFFLYDLNPESITMVAKGKNLYITGNTYENYPLVIEKSMEKEDKFRKEVSFFLTDVKDAKIARQTMISEIENCVDYFENTPSLKVERDSLVSLLLDTQREKRTRFFRNPPTFVTESSVVQVGIGLLSNVNLKEQAYENDFFQTSLIYPAISLTYERNIWNNFGLGLSVATQSWKVPPLTIDRQEYNFRYRYHGLGIRATYHLNFHPRLDSYLGITTSVRYMDIASSGEIFDRNFNLDAAFLVGMRFYITDTIGVFLEVSDETLSWCTTGFTFNF